MDTCVEGRACTLYKKGKSKQVWGCPDSSLVVIENTDRITAYNGLKQADIHGKGWYATQTSNNCFRYLETQGIPTHFICDDNREGFGHKFWARNLTMLPVEFVVRNVAYGSYLARNPDVPIAEPFAEPIIEFYEKNDVWDDPMLIVDMEAEVVERHKPDRPRSRDSLIDVRPFRSLGYLMLDRWPEAIDRSFSAALALKKAWEQHNATLVDIKFECGVSEDNKVVLGDSIDADCWRLWRQDASDPLDRQLFKDDCSHKEIIAAQKYIWLKTSQWLPIEI